MGIPSLISEFTNRECEPAGGWRLWLVTVLFLAKHKAALINMRPLTTTYLDGDLGSPCSAQPGLFLESFFAHTYVSTKVCVLWRFLPASSWLTSSTFCKTPPSSPISAPDNGMLQKPLKEWCAIILSLFTCVVMLQFPLWKLVPWVPGNAKSVIENALKFS